MESDGTTHKINGFAKPNTKKYHHPLSRFMKYLLFIAWLFVGLHVYGQPALVANDTSKVYYSKTDFNLEDSLDLWIYYVEKDLAFSREDSIQPLYKLTFKRLEPINNYTELYKQLDTVSWKVHITYKVYRLADSAYCFEKSAQIRKKTNFIPPFAGGDYFIIGKFIFLNTEYCIACIQLETNADYCRPTVNRLISNIDRSRPFSIEGIVRQFPIKRIYPDSKRKKARS